MPPACCAPATFYRKYYFPVENPRTDRIIRSFVHAHFPFCRAAADLRAAGSSRRRSGARVHVLSPSPIVADDHLALRPLELNHRDVVSLLNLVYEGLFEIDDNYQPQPKLAYAYSFSNDGRKVQVTLRDDISFHNGQTLTSADVVATLDYMLELAGFDENLDSEVPVADRGPVLLDLLFHQVVGGDGRANHRLHPAPRQLRLALRADLPDSPGSSQVAARHARRYRAV